MSANYMEAYYKLEQEFFELKRRFAVVAIERDELLYLHQKATALVVPGEMDTVDAYRKILAESEDYAEKQAHLKSEAYGVITTLRSKVKDLEEALVCVEENIVDTVEDFARANFKFCNDSEDLPLQGYGGPTANLRYRQLNLALETIRGALLLSKYTCMDCARRNEECPHKPEEMGHIFFDAVAVNNALFEDKHISADDMKFMEDMNSLPQMDIINPEDIEILNRLASIKNLGLELDTESPESVGTNHCFADGYTSQEKERQMMNREMAEATVKKMDDNYDRFIPADMSPFLEKEYDSFRADMIEQALNEAEERGRSGARNHPGCDYSATIYCNKCGWLGSKDQPTLFQDNNRALRETLEYIAIRIWTVYRDLDKVTNVVQREMLYNLNNEIQRVLGDTK